MYPTLDEVRALEKEALKAVWTVGTFARIRDIVSEARQAGNGISPKGTIDFHLGFELDIRLRSDKGQTYIPRRVDIGGKICPAKDGKNVESASYSVMICSHATPSTSEVLRKIHFDYESAGSRMGGEPKPSVHMQVCGKLSPHHVQAGFTQDQIKHLNPGFEKPRIPSTPMSLALLMNWLLLEFQNGTDVQAILSDPHWRKTVAKAERMMLRPFYQGGIDFLVSAANAHRRFYQDYLYSMSSD